MKFLYGLGGANVPVIKEFELSNASEAIEAGQALKCTNRGLVGKNVTGEYIGVAAEDHSGKEDLLNPRANGKKIRIDITKNGVYSVPAMRLTAVENGTSTTLVCENSGYVTGNLTLFSLMLVAKGEGSTNTDSIGKVRKISDITTGTNYTYEIEEGGVTCKGDVYAVIPYVGFIGGVDYDYKGMNLTDDLDAALMVTGVNKTDATIEVKFNDSTLF
ncbi:MAG: hypothetical protein IJZ20_07475 [Clostridia bacterium]|nr:hypothetical protein [Clostridia bacterium]